MNENNYLEGFCPEDSKMTVEYPTTNKAVVFDCFCGSVSAIEEETHRKDGLAGIGYAPLSYGATRTLQLVSDFDDFVNAPDFQIGLYAVGKLEMENFWRVIAQRNNFAICNKAVSDGKSAIWEITKGGKVFGFLLNNMTFDGQNSYFLFCLKEKQVRETVLSTKTVAKQLFIQKGKFPKELGHNGKYLSRWGKIVSKLDSVGGTTINAWSILESEDARVFYGELKKHNVLSEADKGILKEIRKIGYTKPFSAIVEEAEAELKATENRIEELEETVEYAEVSIENLFNGAELKETANAEVLNQLVELVNDSIIELQEAETELSEIKAKLLDLTEENNSEAPETTVDDYYVPVDLMEKYN